MESTIQKINFLKNENCIFSFFKTWNMDLNFIFRFFFWNTNFNFNLSLNAWNLIVTSKSFCLIFRCLFCIKSDLIQWLLLGMMTFQQTKWIVGKWIAEMFQKLQLDYRWSCSMLPWESKFDSNKIFWMRERFYELLYKKIGHVI